ncbi:MAG: hypothetical protein A2513_06395 [Sulfurimonas sp. RIFOXYD12_FULL_33_39]|nr:MAG: hypothetical protein A2513_06395 [Sulfurimonas sp. RIFOXYD12_FULL_33_39]OHE14942.1 MAG: hypothetical protein A2530_00585 [Sulfurimonas sp. RIFOXYD2_FULL_34_21]DAB28232.1 MAG TPA: hypothetical protein CFH78_03475 [Sulfurimonas sp. UBA10385]
MKYMFILFLSLSSVFAQDFSTRYDVYVTLFGNVGYSDVTLKESGDNYEIKLDAYTIGTAAVLLRHRVETYISKGKIINGIYRPELFIKIKETTKKTTSDTYYFNHDKKEITLIEEKTKLVNKMQFNPANFELISKEVKESSKKETLLDIYKDNDVLSSYLNTKANCNKEKKSYRLIAFGAHDEKNSIILSYLEDKERESAKLNFSGNIANIYNLHVEPLDKDDSIVDVLIAFDSDGLLKEALMDEIFWVGKITAKRVYHKISSN